LVGSIWEQFAPTKGLLHEQVPIKFYLRLYEIYKRKSPLDKHPPFPEQFNGQVIVIAFWQ
jgi:hypothetical protein